MHPKREDPFPFHGVPDIALESGFFSTLPRIVQKPWDALLVLLRALTLILRSFPDLDHRNHGLLLLSIPSATLQLNFRYSSVYSRSLGITTRSISCSGGEYRENTCLGYHGRSTCHARAHWLRTPGNHTVHRPAIRKCVRPSTIPRFPHYFLTECWNTNFPVTEPIIRFSFSPPIPAFPATQPAQPRYDRAINPIQSGTTRCFHIGEQLT